MIKIITLGFKLGTPSHILPVLWKRIRMWFSLIVTLNLHDYYSGGLRRNFFVSMMKKHLIKTSFFFLKNHGIPEKLLKEVRKLFLRYCALPEEKKMKYHFPEVGGQYGFTPFGTEKGDGATVADTKEFFQVGDLHPFPYIEEIPELQAKMKELFDAMRKAYQALLGPLSLILGKTAKFMLNKEGNSILRLINYPAQANPQRDKGDKIIDGGNAANVCAFKHNDINVLTLLPTLQKGLELWFRRRWRKIQVKPKYILVNAGLMLEHLSNGLIKAGPHQVVCKKGIQRFTPAFFGHVLPLAKLEPLPGINGEPNYRFYPFKIAHWYLMDILVKIGLIAEPTPLKDTAGGDIQVMEDETDSLEKF